MKWRGGVCGWPVRGARASCRGRAAVEAGERKRLVIREVRHAITGIQGRWVRDESNVSRVPDIGHSNCRDELFFEKSNDQSTGS